MDPRLRGDDKREFYAESGPDVSAAAAGARMERSAIRD